jgi:hypothetical protein
MRQVVNAREIITDVVSRGAAPVAKAAGFRKSRLTFHRRHGQVVQVVNFQLSQYNFADAGSSFVNVGVAFDSLWQLDRKEISQRPKEYECHYRSRWEHLLPNAPAEIEVTSHTDVQQTADAIRSHFTELVTLLDPVRSPESFLEQDWLHVGAELELRACLKYVLGDDSGAFEDVGKTAAFFSDRQGMSVAHLIERRNLERLKAML